MLCPQHVLEIEHTMTWVPPCSKMHQLNRIKLNDYDGVKTTCDLVSSKGDKVGDVIIFLSRDSGADRSELDLMLSVVIVFASSPTTALEIVPFPILHMQFIIPVVTLYLLCSFADFSPTY